MEEPTREELMELVKLANETIQEQFQTILWLNKYIRQLEAERDNARKYRKLETFS